MKSMTGFGRASVDTDNGQLIVELRTVNHRGLDIKLRSRDLDAATENALLAAVKSSLKRGSVAINIEAVAAQTGVFDQAWYQDVARSVFALAQSLELPTTPDLATIAAFAAQAKDGQDRGGATRVRPSWERLQPVLLRALLALDESRCREGGVLKQDVTDRLGRLVDIAGSLAARAAGAAERAATRLHARVAVLLGDSAPDPQRLAQEIALLADRADVTEELVRLRAHLAHFGALLTGTADNAPDGVGRRMDFWLQEIGREFNTLASKSQDADVSVLVVDAKAELEKIREQAQNIE